ncbi:perlucin-like protein [Saccostrea cucullata]|uniref:perlucin-like protein n=1 Tax=Saccostrea cuccullata TaxID=36930 RepID=UPI002ED2DC7C
MSSCSEGWMQYLDHCYLLRTTPTSWDNAILQCQSLGSYLVEIETKEEDEWIRKIGALEIPSVNGIWTGGTVFGNEHSFIWNNSKKELNYTNWEENEPNNYGGNEDCLVIIVPDGNWYDEICDKQYQFVCEKKHPF